jgi:hypothetical protein
MNKTNMNILPRAQHSLPFTRHARVPFFRTPARFSRDALALRLTLQDDFHDT